jgi:carbonic anhydrase
MKMSSLFAALFCGTFLAIAPAAIAEEAQSPSPALVNHAKSELGQIAAAVQHIVKANDAFVNEKKPSYFSELIKGQKPKATVVSCSDSRVHAHALDLDPDGDLFMVREIGNQIASGEGSIEYGIRHLHTPIVIVIGHSSCGAVKAAMGDYSGIEPAIKKELDTIEVPKGDANDPARVKASVELNVNNQVDAALEKFAPEIKTRKLAVVGAVYDFRNDYAQGFGRLVIVNINGEIDPAKIKSSELLLMN